MRVRRRRSKRGEWFNLLIFLSSFACWQASVMALKVMESATQASHTHVRSCSHMHAHTLSRWKHAYFAYEWHHRKLFSRVGFFFFLGGCGGKTEGDVMRRRASMKRKTLVKSLPASVARHGQTTWHSTTACSHSTPLCVAFG